MFFLSPKHKKFQLIIKLSSVRDFNNYLFPYNMIFQLITCLYIVALLDHRSVAVLHRLVRGLLQQHSYNQHSTNYRVSQNHLVVIIYTNRLNKNKTWGACIFRCEVTVRSSIRASIRLSVRYNKKKTYSS